MKTSATLAKLSTLIITVLLSSQAIADVKLPTVMDSNMILQRDQKVNIWGWADSGEKVAVTLAGETKSTKADNSGNWNVEFPAQKANKKGQAIKIKGNNAITLENVLFGDVWIGSGQSNMQWSLGQVFGGREAINASENQNIRLYNVPRKKSGNAEKDIKAKWKICGPGTLNGFSAALYFFGREVNRDADIPLGLIHSSWGGSPIEEWLCNGRGNMYHAMIAPLHNFPIKGVIWYQGESNVGNGMGYYDKHKALIEGWRGKWNNKKMPFYFVQIAPWGGRSYPKGKLPELWEAQVKTLNLPFTGMAVTTDIVHNIGDIHPKNKIDVGERLALWALARDYGKDVVYSGPLYKSHKVKGSEIHITFAHVGKGLVSRDGNALNEFQIAGEDGQFVSATAKIVDKTVVVSAEGVKEPKNVRFGWHKTTNPNLMNKSKLPASPFQTDNWQGGTAEPVLGRKEYNAAIKLWAKHKKGTSKKYRAEAWTLIQASIAKKFPGATDVAERFKVEADEEYALIEAKQKKGDSSAKLAFFVYAKAYGSELGAKASEQFEAMRKVKKPKTTKTKVKTTTKTKPKSKPKLASNEDAAEMISLAENYLDAGSNDRAQRILMKVISRYKKTKEEKIARKMLAEAFN